MHVQDVEKQDLELHHFTFIKSARLNLLETSKFKAANLYNW